MVQCVFRLGFFVAVDIIVLYKTCRHHRSSRQTSCILFFLMIHACKKVPKKKPSEQNTKQVQDFTAVTFSSSLEVTEKPTFPKGHVNSPSEKRSQRIARSNLSSSVYLKCYYWQSNIFVLISYNLNMCCFNGNPLCIPLLLSVIVLPYIYLLKAASPTKTCDSTWKGDLGQVVCHSRDKDGCTPHVRVPRVFSWCPPKIIGDCDP